MRDMRLLSVDTIIIKEGMWFPLNRQVKMNMRAKYRDLRKSLTMFTLILHIKKSFCNCPFAEGNRKVCKHKIAIYFSAFPEKAEEYYKSLKSYDEPEFDDDYFDEDDEFDGDFREIVCDILNHRISKMTKSEAQSALYDIIESAPEWMLRDFVNNWIWTN